MKIAASIAVLATAVLSFVSAQTGPVDLANCATGPTQLTATSFSITPVPMCITKPYCITATGTLSTEIKNVDEYNATFAVTGRYLGRLIYTDNKNLCDLLAESGQPCPIPAGPVTLKICNNLKQNLPPNIGYAFQFNSVNTDGGVIFCGSGELIIF
ncbi:hypothetical protein BGW39_011139 [Mortierella sp. 14UC]|nr:hypothetical protein BGW39_011139 [Mortierella sp. 14UC]